MIAVCINILIILSRKLCSEFILCVNLNSSWIATCKSLETIYIACIRPILKYGDVTWNDCNQYEMNELDKIQKEGARITTGATKLVSLDNLYKEVSWQTLHKRHQDYKIILFYKMFN